MRSLLLFTSLLLFALTCAESSAESPKQPLILPDSGYAIHDLERPAPPKIQNVSALLVPPPSDAVVLFDGSGLAEWEGGAWLVQEGILTANEADLLTKKEFGSCQLHLEFRIPEGRQVEGQIGANSGVFFMNLYEVQIQESHTNTTYPDGQAAALYGQAPPLVNASSPQGTWQSYDLIFEAPRYDPQTPGKVLQPARITLLHNGVVVHYSKELMGPTRHKALASYPKEHPPKGPLKLQWHQDPIEFRNIWIRDLSPSPQ